MRLAIFLAACTLVIGDPDPRDRAGADLSTTTACADVQTDPHNCGSCGHDCGALPGVNPMLVGCVVGVCDLRGACLAGRADCTGGYLDGCETDLSSASHCGGCTAECAGETPLCARNMNGTFSCSASCGAGAPTQCGSSCVDTSTDPQHCGNCMTACPAGSGQVAVCQNGVCGTQCDFGFHSCSGVCSDDSSLDTCAARCTPCPAPPANAVEICDPKAGCDFQCNGGFVRQTGSCVAVMDMMSSMADLRVDNRPSCDCSGLGMACLEGCVGHNCCQECTPGDPLGLCFTGTSCTADPSCKPL